MSKKITSRVPEKKEWRDRAKANQHPVVDVIVDGSKV